ncbi:MAG: DUF45 domain-containing protein [Prevotella sp.]|nr:DUF45 domain-containing protein [Prevotella sp.]
MRIVRNGDVHVSAPFGMSKKDVEDFISQHQEWIVAARKKTAERRNQRDAFFNQLPLTTKTQKIEANEKVKALVEPVLERFTKVIGVSPCSVRYKPMISRWGTCNVKERSVCYSTYLLLLPDWCVEHVVVHELCHLLEPSHNARFHELMDKYYPKWKEARKETRIITKGKCSRNL